MMMMMMMMMKVEFLWSGCAVAALCAAAVQQRKWSTRTVAWFTSRSTSAASGGGRGTFMTLNASHGGDYALMLLFTALISTWAYGAWHPINVAACAMCPLLLAAFVVRRGVAWRVPLLLQASGPRRVCTLVANKLDNTSPLLWVAIAVLCVEQALLPLLDSPERRAANRVYGDWLHWLLLSGFGALTLVRFAVLLEHVRQRDAVFDFLRASQWRKSLGKERRAARELVDLAQAFATGVCCHALAIAPLCVVLRLEHSLALLPARLVVDAVVYYVFWSRDFNRWLLRDHWNSHTCELTFVYMHAAHHDALPVSMMASHDTGMLEGFVRFGLGQPEVFLNPGLGIVLVTFAVVADMVFHQYVPGVFPYASTVRRFGHRHAEHHFLSLLPLGSAFERPPDGNAANSIAVDEQLTGYAPNNALWSWFVAQVERIEDRQQQQQQNSNSDERRGADAARERQEKARHSE